MTAARRKRPASPTERLDPDATRWILVLLLALAVAALCDISRAAQQIAQDYRDLNVDADTLPAAWSPPRA